MKFDIWVFLKKSVENIQVSILTDILHEYQYIFIISRAILLRTRNFFSENRAVYEIMWKNTVQLDRPHKTITRIRMSMLDTYGYRNAKYVALIAFPLHRTTLQYTNAPQCYVTRTLPVLMFCIVFCTQTPCDGPIPSPTRHTKWLPEITKSGKRVGISSTGSVIVGCSLWTEQKSLLYCFRNQCRLNWTNPTAICFRIQWIQ